MKSQSADPSASLVLFSDMPPERVQPAPVRSQWPGTRRPAGPPAASPEVAVIAGEHESDDARDFVFAADTHSVSREVQEFGFPGANHFRPTDPELVPIRPALATAPPSATSLVALDLDEPVTYRREQTQADQVHDEPVLAPVEQNVSIGLQIRSNDSENARRVSWLTWSIAAGLFIALYRKAIPNWWPRCKTAFGFRFPRRFR
jgi:hypothetical protein